MSMTAREWIITRANELNRITQQQIKEASDKQTLKALKKQLTSIKLILDGESKKEVSLPIKEILFEQGTLLEKFSEVGDKSVKLTLNDFLYILQRRPCERILYSGYSFISKSDLIMFMVEFFHSLDENFYELFLKLYKDMDKNHYFFDPTSTNEAPFMYPIFGSNTVLTCSTYNNDFDDYFNLIHEFSHGVEFIANPNFFISRGGDIFSEVIPIFMELISLDLMEKYDKANVSIVHHNMACDYYNIGMRAFMSLIVSKIGMKFYEKSENAILQQCAREMHLSPVNVKEIATDTMDKTFKYIISYMMAIELYMIYKSDKEKALNIVWKYCLSKDSSPERINRFFINEGCIAGRSAEAYFMELKKARR